MNVRDYFDLNKPVTFGRPGPAGRRQTPAPTSPSASGQQLNTAWQIATYFIIVVSIVASRYLDLYRAGALASFQLNLPYVLFLAVVSLAAFPYIYDRARFSNGQPILLQIGLIFSAGMGWEKIISTTIGK